MQHITDIYNEGSEIFNNTEAGINPSIATGKKYFNMFLIIESKIETGYEANFAMQL